MPTVHHALFVAQAVRLLPQWLLGTLDGWSHRVAQRRARERQQRWLARQQAAAAVMAQPAYHLKPWRD